MIMQFLTETTEIANGLGVPEVSTDDLTSKFNGIMNEVLKLFTGSFANIAMVCFIISIIMFVVCAVFFKKGLKTAGISMIAIFVGMMIFLNATNIIGWIMHIAK